MPRDTYVWHDGPVQAGPERAERRLLVSELETTDGFALLLADPVVIEAGETFWTDGNDLVVERHAGAIERHSGEWESRCR